MLAYLTLHYLTFTLFVINVVFFAFCYANQSLFG